VFGVGKYHQAEEYYGIIGYNNIEYLRVAEVPAFKDRPATAAIYAHFTSS